MSYRLTLAAVAAVFTQTGCAKTNTTAPATAFDLGSTRLTVAHVQTKTDDGTKIYVTIDGKDAGALGIGEDLEVQLPEGKHKVGGYARSLIGRVTISPVDVTTSRNDISHVTYSVANLKPTFLVRAPTPVPKPKSESMPLDPIPALPKHIETEAPATDGQTQAATPAAPASSTTATPATAAPATTSTTTSAPATTPATTTSAAPATAPATQTESTAPATQTSTQSVPVTVLQSQTDTTTSSPQAANITELQDPQS